MAVTKADGATVATAVVMEVTEVMAATVVAVVTPTLRTILGVVL